MNRVIRTKTLKMRPSINTSYRAHGKWGDFLAAIIPTIWCLNILINSNFLLRMLEWQSESSLFTIRIRGRQWYWVYKIDLKAVADLYNTPKNIGRNNWTLTNDLTKKINLNFLQLRLYNNNTELYFSDLIKKNKKKFFKNSNVALDNNFSNYLSFKNAPRLLLTTELTSHNVSTLSSQLQINFFMKLNTNFSNKFSSALSNFFFSLDKFFLKYKTIELTNYCTYNYKTKSSEDLILKDRFFKKNYSNNSLLTISETNFNEHSTTNLNLEKNQQTTVLKEKFNNYAVIKQKRYARKKNILPATILKNNKKYLIKPYLSKNSLINNTNLDLTIFYKLLKKNKSKLEVASVLLSKRLLRTKRTLVLPAHVNITAITNSYDVIHSWFIPGLGLKLDCVPGRATHHTFFIDNYGFYYGQCAEVCGRYHHHMPIRVCALPFDHFLIWWSTFGLTKLFNLNNNIKTNFLKKKFIW